MPTEEALAVIGSEIGSGIDAACFDTLLAVSAQLKSGFDPKRTLNLKDAALELILHVELRNGRFDEVLGNASTIKVGCASRDLCERVSTGGALARA